VSEESLRLLLEKLQSDEKFRQAMIDDPTTATETFDLSSTEIEALASNDEDALRRLGGVDTAAFGMSIGIDSGLGKLKKTVQGCYTEWRSGCPFASQEFCRK
jgi:hypothetical protein